MKKLICILTFLIISLNLACLTYFFPDAIRANGSEFDNIIKETKRDSGELDEVSKQMILDYPDLPEKVKMLLDEYPDFASERSDAILSFSKSNKGLITILVFNSLFIVIWGVLTMLYFRVGGIQFKISDKK